jgi:hypothetical protein
VPEDTDGEVIQISLRLNRLLLHRLDATRPSGCSRNTFLERIIGSAVGLAATYGQLPEATQDAEQLGADLLLRVRNDARRQALLDAAAAIEAVLAQL